MGLSDADVATRENQQLQLYLASVLDIAQPPDRLPNTLPSVLTSVDVKLTYDRAADRFQPYVIGDINANPEGIAVHDAKVDIDLPSLVADRFVSNTPGDDLDVVVSLPEAVFDRGSDNWIDEASWLTQDKKTVTDAVESLSRVAQVYKTVDAAGMMVSDGELYYAPPDHRRRPVDGYVNLYDLGEALATALNEDIEAFSRGANAPTAVWNSRYPWSNKVGLLRKTAELLIGVSEVEMPRFQQVHTIADIREFVRTTGQATVLKGPYGTWGDEVVFFRSVDEIERKILEKERLVQDRRNWPEFSILDLSSEQLQFTSRSGGLPAIQYGHVEEVIEGEFQRADTVYDVVEIPPAIHPEGKTSPIDFVPLSVRARDDDEVARVPSIMLRLSGKPTPNANASTDYLTYASLEEAFKGAIAVPGPTNEFNVDLKAVLEEIAGREVRVDEIRSAVESAGLIAFAVRNLAAFAAERRNTHHMAAE